MTDSEYVPGERKVRADFVLARTRNFDSYMMGRTLASEQERYGDEFDRWIDKVKAEAAREALTGLAVEMERLDSDRIEAESANLPPDTIGTSDTIRRAENMHEEPWEFVYEHIDSDAYLENLDLEKYSITRKDA